MHNFIKIYFFQIFNFAEVDVLNSGSTGDTIFFKCAFENNEDLFLYLAEKMDKEVGKEKTDRLLEMPDCTGKGPIYYASYKSEKITKLLLERGIQLNTIGLEFQTPSFKYKSLVPELLKAKINPKIIDKNGKTQLDKNPSSFSESDLKEIEEKFSSNTYFAISPQNCSNCPEDCKSNLRAFYCNDGTYLPENAKKLGEGAFGAVREGIWHGKPAAFKSVLITSDYVFDEDDFHNNHNKIMEKQLGEMKATEGLSESSILQFVGHYRQQIQEEKFDEEKNETKTVALNFEIYVMPKCNMDLCRFKKEFQPTGKFLNFIFQQCLKRKCYNLYLFFSKQIEN